MKKLLGIMLVLSLGILLVSGCQQAQQPPKLISNESASGFSKVGIQLSQWVNTSMGSWAESGVVSGMATSSIKGASVNSKAVTGPDADGYYHVTGESTVLGYITYEADLYVKLATDEAGRVTNVYVYGSYSQRLNCSGESISYTMTFGNGKENPYHGTTTWSGNGLTSLSANGPLTLAISTSSGGETHSATLAFTLENYSINVTAGADYPTGKITIALTYDGTGDANNIVITFDGDDTATLSYGDYTTTIQISPA